MSYAVANYAQVIALGVLQNDGHAAFTSHIGHAHKRFVSARDARRDRSTSARAMGSLAAALVQFAAEHPDAPRTVRAPATAEPRPTRESPPSGRRHACSVAVSSRPPRAMTAALMPA